MNLTLRTKILSAAVVTFLLAGGILSSAVSYVLLAEFSIIERESVLTNVRRMEGAIEERLTALQSFCGDWTPWNETRDFVLGKNPDFVLDNLQAGTFTNARIEFMVFLDREGKMVYSKTVDIDEIEDEPNETVQLALANVPQLLHHTGPRDNKHGIVMLPVGPALVASGPVTDNDFNLPINGTLIVGRTLTGAEIDSLAARTHLSPSIYRVDTPTQSEHIRDVLVHFAGGEQYVVHEESDETVAAYTLLRDVAGHAALVLRVEQPRALYKEGQQATYYFTTILIAVGLLTFVILLLLINRNVLSPLAKLNAHIVRTRGLKDLETRVDIRTSGEIGGLATAYNEMTDHLREAQRELDKAHRSLVDRARESGMADVATGILHNVGNVLNSVNVSASAIRQRLVDSRVPNLVRATALIDEHRSDLGTFLTQDERGSKLPDYLVGLSKHLKEEQDWLDLQLVELERHIQHIGEIVSMQQSLAKTIGLVEPADVAEIVEEAIKINVAALDRHGITLKREFTRLPAIMLDRHLLLQVLVNLLSNAKYALRESDRPKQIIVRIEPLGSDKIRISVSDNGGGIAPENMDRIFNYGFTTRKDGHGFGLHTAALAVNQLGGTIVVHSDGPGTGATFILEIPRKEAQGNTQ